MAKLNLELAVLREITGEDIEKFPSKTSDMARLALQVEHLGRSRYEALNAQVSTKNLSHNRGPSIEEIPSMDARIIRGVGCVEANQYGTLFSSLRSVVLENSYPQIDVVRYSSGDRNAPGGLSVRVGVERRPEDGLVDRPIAGTLLPDGITLFPELPSELGQDWYQSLVVLDSVNMAHQLVMFAEQQIRDGRMQPLSRFEGDYPLRVR